MFLLKLSGIHTKTIEIHLLFRIALFNPSVDNLKKLNSDSINNVVII